jgi:chemotaxis protein CheD
MVVAERAIAVEKVIVVNLGDVFVTTDPTAVLSCVGLGSCVAICVYDPFVKVAGIAHVVLPKSNSNQDSSTKFANIAVPLLLDQMRENGAYNIRLVVKIVGGARLGTLKNNHIANNIGERNVEAVKMILDQQGIKIAADDIGGNHGRSVRMHVDSGKVIVKIIGSEGREL